MLLGRATLGGVREHDPQREPTVRDAAKRQEQRARRPFARVEQQREDRGHQAEGLAAQQDREAAQRESAQIACVERVEGPAHGQHRQGAGMKLVRRDVKHVWEEPQREGGEDHAAPPQVARADAREREDAQSDAGALCEEEHVDGSEQPSEKPERQKDRCDVRAEGHRVEHRAVQVEARKPVRDAGVQREVERALVHVLVAREREREQGNPLRERAAGQPEPLTARDHRPSVVPGA
jgi:hypothetical protein